MKRLILLVLALSMLCPTQALAKSELGSLFSPPQRCTEPAPDFALRHRCADLSKGYTGAPPLRHDVVLNFFTDASYTVHVDRIIRLKGYSIYRGHVGDDLTSRVEIFRGGGVYNIWVSVDEKIFAAAYSENNYMIVEVNPNGPF